MHPRSYFVTMGSRTRRMRMGGNGQEFLDLAGGYSVEHALHREGWQRYDLRVDEGRRRGRRRRAVNLGVEEEIFEKREPGS